MIFDGDCHFCRHWIERWRGITGNAVDYAASQELGDRFSEIPRDQFARAVVLVETNGNVFVAAEAVYRSLQFGGGRGWLRWSYEHVPGFARISEAGYRVISTNRTFASFVSQLFWGNDARRPTYFHARCWFFRALGLIYLIAFVSLWVQLDGLIGEKGILPVREFLPAARAELGPQAPLVLPTLCWLNTSNGFLHFLCGAGAISSLLLIVGIVPVVMLAALFILYLSLTIAGQTFLSFQWDILLLETGFFAIFFAPLQLWTRRAVEAPLSAGSAFLLKLLLFKLIFMSGVVKLTSGDACWLDLTALDYHYWTQPLPTIVGWWANQSPQWLKKISVAATLSVELIVPFFIWLPRRPRTVACIFLVLLQIAIALTGNYSFFNLLVIALCLLLVDDTVWASRRGKVQRPLQGGRWPAPVLASVMLFVLPLDGWLIFTGLRPEARWPRPLAIFYGHIESFRILNGYGLFRVMTKERPEIVLEGSADGFHWQPYDFKWKPGDLRRPPGWVAPHQPRLDWQMWFAALGTYDQNNWFLPLTRRFLENSEPVTRLLAGNPFPDAPPRFVRAQLYAYEFATPDERRRNGEWWKRQARGEYLPPVSLADFR